MQPLSFVEFNSEFVEVTFQRRELCVEQQKWFRKYVFIRLVRADLLD